ncbi:hypothetical protein [Amycolatopsis sp. A1MSW2902]|uniref:hypothetical protein n=1 Tax=Amycolatopsis sp. A1MSW2902 TaxID=687413 RepID=UPI00307CDCF4
MRQLKQAKDARLRVPAGYALLRYLTGDMKGHPEVLFNYLGRFDVEAPGEEADWRPEGGLGGRPRSRNPRRRTPWK